MTELSLSHHSSIQAYIHADSGILGDLEYTHCRQLTVSQGALCVFYWFTVTSLNHSPMNGGWKHRASPTGKAARCKHASSVWISPQESGLCVDIVPTHIAQKSHHEEYSQWRHSSPQYDFNSERMCINRL